MAFPTTGFSLDEVIDYLKGVDTAARLLDSLPHEGLAISLITYGEIV
jgi:hypothetical protein